MILIVSGALALFLLVWVARNYFPFFAASVPKIPDVSITSFEECVKAGNPILESYPSRCATKDGKLFTEDIGNVLEKVDLIRAASPRPNAVIKSPLVIEGEARGYWFFEASFPAELFDADGQIIGTGIMQAEGEWMTEEFVPYKGTIAFRVPAAKRGTLILKKDNPSGLPEHDDFLRIPVIFSE